MFGRVLMVRHGPTRCCEETIDAVCGPKGNGGQLVATARHAFFLAFIVIKFHQTVLFGAGSFSAFVATLERKAVVVGFYLDFLVVGEVAVVRKFRRIACGR
ncbi:MAG: hypothetical protein HXX15_00745 [Rhodopseudomonas sp.]|uniref:hypothetical protein n=1 Tax=Rhodopseudomonas sp. TaxID=1078 RepID=UPI00184530D7|nr:hypothetical protein [Rhodopseudomonas sp.]NVN84587.1 hypothetical protein [Rhodopseudomonas sp.]